MNQSSTMEHTLNILMIDDHPTIIEGYKKILSYHKNLDLQILIAKDCAEAIDQINRAKLTTGFDMFFVDIQIPASKDGRFTSGEDLAIYAKEKFPNAKIVILTMIDSVDRLHNIINTVPHDCILIKSDTTAKVLRLAFEAVLNDKEYYSQTVKQLKNKIIKNNYVLDEIDMKILHHLSKGVKTKNLTHHIDLSLSAIEKRKKNIKLVFDVDGDSELLLLEAKNRGFI